MQDENRFVEVGSIIKLNETLYVVIKIRQRNEGEILIVEDKQGQQAMCGFTKHCQVVPPESTIPLWAFKRSKTVKAHQRLIESLRRGQTVTYKTEYPEGETECVKAAFLYLNGSHARVQQLTEPFAQIEVPIENILHRNSIKSP